MEFYKYNRIIFICDTLHPDMENVQRNPMYDRTLFKFVQARREYIWYYSYKKSPLKFIVLKDLSQSNIHLSFRKLSILFCCLVS